MGNVIPRIKNQMDENTILFILKEEKSLGYNYKYYTMNYENIQKAINQNNIDNISRILYKVKPERDSWIDLNLATQMFTGMTLQERILAAYDNPDFRIKNLKLIPEALYTDEFGFTSYISPYDGLYDSNNFAKLRIYDPTQVVYNYNDDNLLVNFGNTNIDNAFITLCSLFFEYIKTSSNTVIYKNVRDKMRLISTMNPELDSFFPTFKVYSWENVIKKLPINPVERMNDVLVFDETVGNNGILIYKWTLYNYEIVPDENHRKLKVIGLNHEYNDLIKLNEFHFYKMECTDPDIEVIKYWMRGIPNRFRNRVDFALPIRDSIVTYGGIDHEYEIIDLHSIYYPRSFYSVDGVGSGSTIASLNLLFKPVGINHYLPSGELSIPGEKIIDNMIDYIDEVNHTSNDGIKFDYQDVINVKPFNAGVFHLKYKPIDKSIRVYVNGVFYDYECFEYNKDDNTVKWNMTKENGFENGFIINHNDRVIIIYNVDVKENGLTSIYEVI